MIVNEKIKKGTRFYALLLTMALAVACIQGPWEYRPDDTPVFKGITANAYIVSGRPLTSVCFEKLYDLDESFSESKGFYKTAMVEITGDGGSGIQTVELSPQSDYPNCFYGPEDFIGQSGKTYRLRAVITWDSAGNDVSTEITGTTTIPETWGISRNAKANPLVFSETKPSTSDGGALFQGFLADIPPEIAGVVAELYIAEIAPLAGDSAALNEFLIANSQRILNSVDSILSDESQLVVFSEGDTLTYLDGVLNLTPYFFKAEYSDDVTGVLITQTFSADARHPTTRFDNIASTFGDLEPSYFYFRGTERRIQFTQRLENEDPSDTFTIFEAIPVSNAYLKGGKNTLYFYGATQEYADFVRTYISQHSNANIKAIHSVSGGHGFFAGLSIDSFVLYIKIPDDVQSYTTLEARSDFCSEENWENDDCIEFETTYCRQVMFNDQQYAFDNPDVIKEPEMRNDCLAEAVCYYLEQGKGIDYYEDSILTDGNTLVWSVRNSDGSVSSNRKTFSDDILKSAREKGLEKWCLQGNGDDSLCK